MGVLIILGLSIVSGIFYFIGGESWGNKLFRRVGCAIVLVATLFLTHILKLNLAGILWGIGLIGVHYFCLLSYNKWFDVVCGINEDDDVHAPAWAMTGIVYGLACLPLMFAGVPLYLIIIRAGLLGVLTCWWSVKQDNVFWEASGRGAFLILTLPILMF